MPDLLRTVDVRLDGAALRLAWAALALIIARLGFCWNNWRGFGDDGAKRTSHLALAVEKAGNSIWRFNDLDD